MEPILGFRETIGLAGPRAFFGVWAVWRFTAVTCGGELATAGQCNPSTLARFINVEVVSKAATMGVLVGGVIRARRYIVIQELRQQLADMQNANTKALADKDQVIADFQSKNDVLLEENSLLKERLNGSVNGGHEVTAEPDK